MAKPKCRSVYRLEVKSKKGKKWTSSIFGCHRKSIEAAAEFYRQKLGKDVRVVRGKQN
jgi:hypothetical protein